MSYGIADRLFTNCSTQADYSISKKLRKADQVPKAESGEEIGEGSGWWYEELGLLPTFSTWAQVTFLHMYLLTVRLRGLPTPEAFQVYNRYLFEHFSQAAERRMVEVHALTSRTVRVSYLKDLFVQWRGAIAAYDEGIVKGDAQLAAAIWRNLFKGLATDHKGEELDWAKIAKVVLYMRRSLDNLAEFETQEVIFAFMEGAGPEMFFNPVELTVFARKAKSAEESSSSSQKSPLGSPRT
ncbi:TPA_exp: Ubiquinol cytochrome-c reductase assembly protein CBP3 [Trichophyton benhamiae CBS 112371]|nr:TPA_exp: Ubiquinol cytochrome-c reductase assembly protein CBP3 [Trichophyton benhamiae CBS 112371]